MQGESVDLVLFGAAGDLSRRKLLPALMHLDFSGLLPDNLRILALSREDMSSEQFMVGQEQSWLWCDQLISAWEQRRLTVKTYPAGTKGPAQSELLIGRDGR